MQFWNPLKKFFHNKEAVEYFLALILQDRKTKALAFQKFGGKVEILGRASEVLRTSIEELEKDNLIVVADRVIASAEEALPPNIFPSQTILCVKDEWVEDSKVKKEYLAILRRLKEELELIFLGFVVTTEAVSHLLQKEEGVPTTTILVGKDGDVLTATLVRAGHIVKKATTRIEQDQNLAETLAKILRTFKEFEILPSRITLFDDDSDLEEIRQEVISFPWTKTLQFLHFPKIEVLGQDFVERAVIAGFATQMGVEFETGVKPQEQPIPEATPEQQEEQKLVNQTVGMVEKSKTLIYQILARFKFSKIRLPGRLLPLPSLSVLKLGGLPRFNLPNFFGKNLFLPTFMVIGLLILLTLLYIFIPRATITLFVSHKTIDLEQDVTVSPNIPLTDKSINAIKAEPIELELSQTLEGQASGKKETGEKAKGEVTIYNSLPQTQTFAAGTTITGLNNLKFTLDEKVTVASASGDVFSGTIPSKVNVKVTAAEIGEELNLPSGTVFTLGNLTNVAAKNDNAFSGGSKKEVTVVSRADQDNSTKQLLERLVAQAKDKVLAGKSQDLQKIVDAALTQEILEKKFSKNIDEEINKFSLAMKVRFKTLAFSEEELQSLFEDEIQDKAGRDFVLKDGGLKLSVKDTKLNKDKSVTAKVLVEATLLPKIDEALLKNKSRAKSPNDVSNLLSTAPNVSDYKIKLTPGFPLLPQRLPMRVENIKIVIEENGQF